MTAQPPLPDEARLLVAEDVIEILGISRTYLNEMMREGRIPQPIRIGHKTIRWRLTDITEWIQAGCPAQKAPPPDVSEMMKRVSRLSQSAKEKYL